MKGADLARRIASVLAATLALAGCDGLPRDVEGTSERIARERVVRIGVERRLDPHSAGFVQRLTRATGARVQASTGPLEPMLAALEEGRLDLLLVTVRDDTLLREQAALSPPLDGSEEGDRALTPRAIARNGENRWIMTVERIARQRGTP